MCALRLRRERLTLPLVTALMVFSLGLVGGRAMRPAPPPLIIQRGTNSPPVDPGTSRQISKTGAGTESQPSTVSDAVYMCGARTKKGTPCSRRMHEPVRCWQHKGMKAMLPPEKLIVKE